MRWNRIKKYRREAGAGFDSGSRLMISSEPAPWWMDGVEEQWMLLGQLGVNHNAAGVGIMSQQPAYREPTLAPIQTLIIRTISAELRLAGFRGVLGTRRQKKNPHVHTHWQIMPGMTPSQTTRIQSVHSLGPKFVRKHEEFTQNKPHKHIHVLSAVYGLHAVYFRLKPKLVFAGSWHGRRRAWVESSSSNSVADVAGCQRCSSSWFFFITFWWIRILSGPRRLLLARLCRG